MIGVLICLGSMCIAIPLCIAVGNWMVDGYFGFKHPKLSLDGEIAEAEWKLWQAGRELHWLGIEVWQPPIPGWRKYNPAPLCITSKAWGTSGLKSLWSSK